MLYDTTSSFVEGRCCPLAAFGHNRDGKKGRQQIVFGLLCSRDGCPVAVEVFAGNTADPATVADQVRKIRTRFGIERIALVGDRGMLTTARIRKAVEPAGLDWISALKTADLRTLLRPTGTDGPAPLRPDELLEDAVAEISSPAFPGERLMVCLNPRLRDARARASARTCSAPPRPPSRRSPASSAGPARNCAAGTGSATGSGARPTAARSRSTFTITVTDDDLTWTRNEAGIAAEARLDGIYIVRTSLPADAIAADEAVDAYKALARIERAFRNLKTTRLEVRPIYVYSADHVRAHVFLCARSPATSSGTCVDASPRCCSRTTTPRAHAPGAPPPCSRPASHPAPNRRPPPAPPPTARPCTACAPCSITSPRSPSTGSPSPATPITSSTSPPIPRPPSNGPSNCSASTPPECCQSTSSAIKRYHLIPQGNLAKHPMKFRLGPRLIR